MHRSLRACIRIRRITHRNTPFRLLQRNVARLDYTCSTYRHISSASLQHELSTLNATHGSSDALRLSERQMGKMKSELEEESFDSHPLKFNGVDTYLASLRAGGIEPVLDDLERCKPPFKPPPEGKHYAAAYEELVERLCRTFSKAQLRDFCTQYGIEGKLMGKKQRKDGYAELILTKQWGWENLREVERRRRDRTEVISKKFTVSPHELFLFLGTDGSDLLQLSIDYKVHIAVEAHPLSIKVEGLRGSLKTIEALIASRRKGILQETVKLPLASPMTSNSLQQVSRLANAFIENVGHHGKVLIYANDTYRLESAKRLVVRAAEQVRRRHNVQLLAFLRQDAEEPKLTASLDKFAMYPFISHRATPSTSRGADPWFRCRVVHDWLSNTLGKDGLDSGFLGDPNSTFVDELGQSVTIERLVHDASLDVEGHSIVKAVTGHVVFSGGDATRKPTLLPPLLGHWPINKLLKWTKENTERRLFEPSLPSSLFSTTPLSQTFLHRLTYRCLPGNHAEGTLKPTPSKIIQFEIALEARTQGAEDNEPSMVAELTPATDGSPSLESSRDQSQGGQYTSLLPASVRSKLAEIADYSTQQTTVLGTEGSVSVRVGQETECMLALPGRPLDVRLLIINVGEPKNGAATNEITSYFEEFNTFLRNIYSKQPVPPLFIELEGSSYTLELSASVRRSVEDAVSKPLTSPFAENELLSVHAPAPSIVRTVTESVFDLDTNHTSLTCELTCDNPSSDEDWKTFLANVDTLTRSAYDPIDSKPSQELIGE